MRATVKRAAAVWTVLLAAAMVWGCGGRKTETRPPRSVTLTLANNHPDDYCTTTAVEWFADTVRERTEGRVVIEVYNNGRLGIRCHVWNRCSTGGLTS